MGELCLTKDWFTMATGALEGPSKSLKSRPEMILASIVSKVSRTHRHLANRRLCSPLSINNAFAISYGACAALSVGATDAIATDSTPGTLQATRRGVDRTKSARRCQDTVRGGMYIDIVSTFVGLTPIFAVYTLNTLRAISPAPVSTISANAISARNQKVSERSCAASAGHAAAVVI